MTKGDRLGPFLARGPAALSGAGLRLRQHDPGGAGAVRGDRAGRLSRAGAGLAAGVRRALRQSGQRRLFPHRRRRRGAGGAAGLDQRRRHAQSELHRCAKSGPARGADRRRDNGASRPTGCSTACWRAPPTICSSMPRCSTRSTCGCTPPRSCVTGPDHARFAAAALKLPFVSRVDAARAVGRSAAGGPSGAGQNCCRGRAARRSSASARPARCR